MDSHVKRRWLALLNLRWLSATVENDQVLTNTMLGRRMWCGADVRVSPFTRVRTPGVLGIRYMSRASKRHAGVVDSWPDVMIVGRYFVRQSKGTESETGDEISDIWWHRRREMSRVLSLFGRWGWSRLECNGLHLDGEKTLQGRNPTRWTVSTVVGDGKRGQASDGSGKNA